MKNRFKRPLAFVLAIVLLLATIVTDDLVTIQADVASEETMEVAVGGLDNADIVDGIGLGSVKLTVTVKSAEGTEITTVESEDGSTSLQVPYDSTYQYFYELTSDNYTIAPASGSLDASAGTKTITVTGLTPKYTIASVSGADAIKAGNAATYTAQIAETAWADKVTWSLTGVGADDNVVCTAKGNSCEISVHNLSTDSVSAVLSATDLNGQTATKNIVFSKNDVTLSIAATGAWNNVQVTVSTSPKLANKQISITDGETSINGATDANGVARFAFDDANAMQTFSFTASYAGDGVYKAATATNTFNPDKLSQTVTVTQDNLNKEQKEALENLTYGDSKVLIAELIAEGSQAADYNVKGFTEETDENGNISYESEFASVEIEDGKVYYTPKKGGEYTFSVYKEGDASYNDSADAEIKVAVKKKVIAVDESTIVAKTRVYDGTKNIDVTADVVGEGLVNADKVFGTAAVGVADSADAGEREVTATLVIDDQEMAEKYELENGGEVTASVVIEKKTLHLSVADAEIPWTDIRSENPLKSLEADKLITVTGFVDGESIDTVTLTYPELMIADSTSGLKKTYTLWLKENTGNATNNYQFDYLCDCEKETAICQKGTLTLGVEESNAGAYLTLAADSTHVYSAAENSLDSLYYKYDPESKTDAIAKFSINNEKEYEKGRIIDANGTDVTDGLVLSNYEADEDGIIKIELKVQSQSGWLECKPYKVTFKPDQDKPVVSISIDVDPPAISSFVNTITFGHFKQYNIKTNITVSDAVSGIKSWKYTIVDTTKDVNFNLDEITEDDVTALFYGTDSPTEFEQGPESGEVTDLMVGGTQEEPKPNNYIVFVSATDNVGNTVIYSSNGIVIENLKLNDITVTYEEKPALEEESVAYFNHDVKLKAAVSDNTESISSGVKEIYYTGTKTSGISGEDEKIEKSKETTMEFPQPASLQEIEEAEGEYIPLLEADEGESNKFTVAFYAEDWAGNAASNDGVEKTFVIDKKAPELLTDSSLKLEKTYFNEDVKVVFEVKEAYLDDILLNIQNSLSAAEVKLSELQANTSLQETYGIDTIDISEPVQKDDGVDSAITTVTITFGAAKDHKNDSEYVFTILELIDKAGNVTKLDGAQAAFVIDTTNPVVILNFAKINANSTEDITEAAEISSENAPVYVNEDYSGFTATIDVVERYFTPDDKDYKIAGTNLQEPYTVEIPTAQWENDEQNDIHHKALTFVEDANYSFAFTYTDPAGNPCVYKISTGELLDEMAAQYITLDKTRPTGKVTLNNLVNFDSETELNWWDKFISDITFGLFGKDKVTATLESDDVTSGVASTQYLISDKALSYDNMETAKNWIDSKNVDIPANQQAVIYAKVVDKAGNTEYFSSNGFIVDNQNPEPKITITPTNPSWGKGVYSAGDHPGFDIYVTDPKANDGSFSGLHTITYKIVNGTTGYEEEVTASIDKSAHQQEYKKHISIDPEKFYSNDVQITVTATDWSTNPKVSETAKMKIDNKAPIVKFSFDTSDVHNGKYYKNNKTLTITVDERNFDPTYTPKVTSTTGGGYSFSGWSTNGEITTGTITFSGDSDYTVSYDCYDLAGNKSNTETLEQFTVDKTLPVINVSYDNNNAQNGNYYKASRTATIVINEHNFRAGDVKITTTASDGSAPRVSGWSSSGDRHTATVFFGSDADYTFDISYVDLAGNNAADYAQDKFTVDLTNPTVEITGVKDKSANKGTVAPTININDTNFIADGVTITLKGAKTGTVDVSGMVTRTNTATGQSITFRNFDDDMDDIYTLTAKAVDKAGNETSRSITFSVNRHGSTYAMSDETKALLEKGFTNKETDIVIEETNVDTLEFIELSYSKDGTIVKLTEGEDYTVEADGGDGQWKKYTYTIFAKCFAEEGEYNINISSVDRAENASNNKVQSMDIAFVVDKTSPVMAISNLEHRGRYDADSHQFTLSVKDNTLLSKVELYLDGELVHTYEGDELVVENGKLYIDLDSSSNYQTIKLIAYDEAGNPTDPIEYSVLVTSNKWIQFYANKPLFFGSIAALVVIAGFLFFIIWKKKKKGEE